MFTLTGVGEIQTRKMFMMLFGISDNIRLCISCVNLKEQMRHRETVALAMITTQKSCI